MPTYVDIHVLQTLPPSNINRDDAGTPKHAMYGGVRRARVSSQAWKRATRTAFADHMPKDDLGVRTKRFTTVLTDALARRSGRDTSEVAPVAAALARSLGIAAGKKDDETSYLMFFGRAQIERLVDQVTDLPHLLTLDPGALKGAVEEIPVRATLGKGHPVDVALFGRMVADLPGLNVDAATQVAHALSTHAVEVEFDYYTAVDDENTSDETGAGMIGTIEFNSATLYRYATVGLEQLRENLGGDEKQVADALRLFLTTFTTSMPSGHENSFAHRTTPHAVVIVVRPDQPVNLVPAFESPVFARREGIAAESTLRLASELTRAQDLWGLTPTLVAATYAPQAGNAQETVAAAFGPPVPLTQAIASTVEAAMNANGGVTVDVASRDAQPAGAPR